MNAETNQIFELIRQAGDKATERHVEVCERLTRVETSQPTQPCAVVQQLGTDFRAHVADKNADRRTVLGAVLKTAFSAIVGAIAAFAALWSQK